MECLGPQCASMLLEWLKEQSQGVLSSRRRRRGSRHSGRHALPRRCPVDPLGRRAERRFRASGVLGLPKVSEPVDAPSVCGLDNTIQNALFKIDRYAQRLEGSERVDVEAKCQAIREVILDSREQLEHQRRQARRAELKLSQLGALTPEGFEEFVAELFEALGYEIDVWAEQGMRASTCA